MAEVVRMTSVNALINQTKATWERAEKHQAGTRDWFIRTGNLLIELKGRVEHGQWLPTLQQLGRSERRAQELMELAKGAKTIEEQRGRARKGMQKTRANPRNVTRISPEIGGAKSDPRFAGVPAPEEPDDDYYGSEPTLEERWQNSLANLCADIIVRAPYWDKNMPGWEDFECPSHIRKLVGEAATALASITAKVAKRDRKAG